MSNPFELLPFALAAAAGRIDGHAVNALVAAGVTLLQRAPAVTRALSQRRPALLLNPGAAVICALAASDGHVAEVLDPERSDEQIAQVIASAGVGVVFTEASLAGRLPAAVVQVWLDAAPVQATVRSGGEERDVDLGSHVGLRLEGARAAEWSDLPVVSWGHGETATHDGVMRGGGPRVVREAVALIVGAWELGGDPQGT